MNPFSIDYGGRGIRVVQRDNREGSAIYRVFRQKTRKLTEMSAAPNSTRSDYIHWAPTWNPLYRKCPRSNTRMMIYLYRELQSSGWWVINFIPHSKSITYFNYFCCVLGHTFNLSPSLYLIMSEPQTDLAPRWATEGARTPGDNPNKRDAKKRGGPRHKKTNSPSDPNGSKMSLSWIDPLTSVSVDVPLGSPRSPENRTLNLRKKTPWLSQVYNCYVL